MEKLRNKMQEVIEQLFGVKVEPIITPAPEATGADYASNVAMQLAKVVHKNPMVVAEMIKGEFANELQVEIANPGFLNFSIPNHELLAEVGNYAHNFAKAVAWHDYANQTIVAEFSDPNPFKVLHVGHLYTSIVGDSISRLLEFGKAKVVRANFGGDVGLHVAKTLYALLERSDRTLAQLTIEDIAQCYVEGARAYEEDEAAKATITKLNKEVYRINAEDLHDSKLAQLYWRGRELSYQYFEEFYAQIGVKFDKFYPESSVADRGLLEVRAHTGTTYEESDGAVVYKGEKVGLHTRVFINREGVPTYEAKDVGLIFTKWDDWHFDESIVVTGNEQSDYMKVVLASVSEYAPQLVDRTTHLTHGLVKLPGNVKMSSRKGNFLKAVEVLEMVEENLQDNANGTISSVSGAKMADVNDMAHSTNAQVPDDEEKSSNEKIATRKEIALAAIKYAFLKYKMGGDIVFDPKESVSTTGNSGVYLLYSSVRARKILQKQNRMVERTFESSPESSIYEKNLCKKVVQYKDVIREAAVDKAPYKICTYLYELSQEFSRFYEHIKVSGNTREDELMDIVRAYYNVMEHGLAMLGIAVPEAM